MGTDAVEAYYDNTVAAETRRLDDSWLEYGVTRAWIGRDLAPHSVILDLGGGPGRYALDLAAEGHRVTLADLSLENIRAARKEADRRGIDLVAAEQVDARHLAGFGDQSFDVVLCLGPIYHLLADHDRAAVLAEVLRVLRPGGTAFVGFLSRMATIHFMAKQDPAAMGTNRAMIDHLLSDGRLAPERAEGFFTEARFDPPEDIAPILAAAGFENLRCFGAEGGLAQSEARLGALPDAARADWLDLAVTLSDTRMGLYGSEHLVGVGAKPA